MQECRRRAAARRRPGLHDTVPGEKKTGGRREEIDGCDKVPEEALSKVMSIIWYFQIYIS